MTAVFDRETWAFLDALARDNTKATFDAARDTYQEQVVAPSAAFVDAMATLLAERVHPDLRGEAKVGRSLFRINRDTRFAKDKTPYKTYLDFMFWMGDGPPREQPACIVRLTSTEVLRRDGFHLSTTHTHPPSIDNDRFPAWCATRLARHGDLLDRLAGA